MRTLDCGCEVTADGNTLLSMCSMHAGHMRARQAVENVPRNHVGARMSESQRELQRDLVKLLAPVIVSKWSTVTDPHSSTEAIFQYVGAIMARFD
jgi:hypothetical protein